jgi:DNA-binding winged helix-turn-helix (wHTH) protein
MPRPSAGDFAGGLVYPWRTLGYSLGSGPCDGRWKSLVEFFFSEHRLDVDRRELRRGRELIAVEPQVFDLLVYLLQNRDRVVSKDELIATVWGGRIVSESTLTGHIHAARKAVGDSGEAQRLIRTLPRKGVRFIGAVRHDDDAAVRPDVDIRRRPRLSMIGETIPLIEQAIRLSPRDPFIANWFSGIGRVYLVQSSTDEAISWFEKARGANPSLVSTRAFLAATYALKGETGRAAAELAEVRRLSERGYYSSITRMKETGYFGVPKVLALFETTFFAGLRKAGVPD